MNYTHLTQDERYQIHALRRQGVSVARIAAELERDRSTIFRELKRNGGPSGYKPLVAHKREPARASASGAMRATLAPSRGAM